MQAAATNYFSETPVCRNLSNVANNFTNGTSFTTLDCGFLVTSATILNNGNFEVCAQATVQFAAQGWHVWNGFAPPAIATSNQPNPCWQFSPASYGPTFTLRHVVYNTQGDSLVCFRTIFIFPDTLCDKDIVTANVKNCKLETTITIDVSDISTPYVITFGDGSLAQQTSATEITHTYGQPGTYDVCLTYTVGEIGIVTCCYPIQVVAPPACTCPADAISVLSVEPCTWVASLLFDLESAYFPISVDFGDSTSGVVNGPNVSHDYPDPGNYYVCYAYVPFPGDTIECCEWVNIPGCCLNASFTLAPNYESPGLSCINPAYKVTPTACLSSIVEVTHIWEFSDGTVFIGPFPPDHIFTNFVDAEGEVCVTHTIICCNDSVSATVCADHFPAAYLGQYGGEIEFDDILPSTGQNVLTFLQQNANGPLPLLIDGLLIANIDGSFSGGTWNMGKDSEILIRGTTATPRRVFELAGTTIRSAVRIPSFPACCRWKGIRSERLTSALLISATVMDANYALHYPSLTAGSPFPLIYSTNSNYENNYYVIKSNRQNVLFSRFHGNTLNGTSLAPHVCGCTAVNAIDFRDVGATQTVSINPNGFPRNTILNYEKGFNFLNTRLNVRDFNVQELREYDLSPGVPNNAAGQSAIGIDFLWSLSGNSLLELDRISFTDFEEQGTLSTAVRDRVSRGNHALVAAASTLGSINTSGIAGGYDIAITSPARMFSSSVNSSISQNTITTDGSNSGGSGFGITGLFTRDGNILRIADNTIDVTTGGTNSLNGGIVVTSTEDLNQDGIAIEHNTNDLALTDGVGIGVTGARNYCVRRNLMSNFSDATGIVLSGGGDATVECNEVLHKPLGASVMLSDENTYSGNFFSANTNDMHFTGDNRGATGSLIRWNEFNFSQGPSLTYEDALTITGEQNHNSYNLWTAQNGAGTFEVVHPGTTGGPGVDNSRFHRPTNAFLGSIHFPRHNPSGMMIPAPNNTIVSAPSTFCNSTNGCDAQLAGASVNAGTVYMVIIQDAITMSSLTAAQQTYTQQGIYGLLLENPSWLNGNSTLSGFKAANDAGFVGQSETLRRAWRQLVSDISAHQATLAPTYASLDALSNQLQQWSDAIAADPSLEASLQGQINAAIQQSEALLAQLQQAEDQFAPTVQATVAQLLAQNNALDGSTTYGWNEKRYNQIALNWLAGTEPDATAVADLRTIAHACLKDGGRAVLDARGLCAVWLKEYYNEGNCTQGREANGAVAEAELGNNMRIVPNPADDMVWISLPGKTADGQQVQVFSVDGRQVFTGKLLNNGELSIPVKGWQGGLYIAKITGGKATFTRSFLVQHP
jgi:Secretion system C-terminal sorting domain/PKD domain